MSSNPRLDNKKCPTDARAGLPILGVVGVNYLREVGFLQMREEARICYFGPADSPLHRLADYSIPVADLDVSLSELDRAIDSAAAKGIHLNGLLSMRDPNVAAVGIAAHRRNLSTAPPEILTTLSSKYTSRKLLNKVLPPSLHTLVQVRRIPRTLSKERFKAKLEDFRSRSPAIIKPENGSCSYHIMPVESRADVERAWRTFRKASDFRGGAFVVEELITGQEFAVETIVDTKVRDMRITQYLPRERGLYHETGHFAPDTFDSQTRKAIIALTLAIHEKLGLRHIITHLELILPPHAPPAIVELNPRLAGDMTQELHRLTTGIQYYRAATHVYLGRDVPLELLNGERKHPCALIRFSPPRLTSSIVTQQPYLLLRHADERFGTINVDPRGIGNTNDDRPAYALLVGHDSASLEKRSSALLSTVSVDNRMRKGVRRSQSRKLKKATW